MAHKRVSVDRGRPSSDYSGSQASLAGLSESLGRIARNLDHEETLEDTIHALVVAAVDAVPGAQAGGITEVRRHGQELDVQFATEQLVRDLDMAQYELGEGPCLDSAYRNRTVRVTDFVTETRWLAFAARACDLGAASALSVQLYVHGEDLGALNLYSRLPEAFDDESEQIALVFATHAAIALSGAKREQQLRVSIDTRDVIGQAKGILMERYKLTADQAFSALRQASSEHHIKLRDVAETVAGTGEIPLR
jgi:GAF domain-containing protein